MLDAPEKALYARKCSGNQRPRHHSDPDSQYLGTRYTEPLAEADPGSSVGSIDDSCDNAVAEPIIGPYRAEAIDRQRCWPRDDDVERATLDRVERFNNGRLLEPIGNIPPADAEAAYYC